MFLKNIVDVLISINFLLFRNMFMHMKKIIQITSPVGSYHSVNK